MSVVTWVISVLFTPITLGVAIINGLVRWRKKEPYVLERLGFWGSMPKQVVWLHGASMGECLSLKLLLASLNKQLSVPVLLTTTTSAARMFMEKFHALVRHQVWDVWPIVALRLYFTRPVVWIAVESEIWPIWMWSLRRKNIPVMLLNARLSKRSMARWQRFPLLARSVFCGIHYATTTSPERAEFLTSMGVRNVEIQPHLKYLNKPLPVPQDQWKLYQNAIGERPVWMVASVHPGERSTIIQAMQQQRNVLTIIAPRHIHTVDEWCEQLHKYGFKGIKHSQFKGDTLEDIDYIMVDSMGELPLFYSLSSIVCVGGSLVPGIGGHNIMEPGSFGCAVLWGPHVDNCRDVCEDLASFGFPLAEASDLPSFLQYLLKNPDEARKKGLLMKAQLNHMRQSLEGWSQKWISRICSISGDKCSGIAEE